MLSKRELHILISRKRDVYDFTLGTCNQSIGLRDDTQCLITLFIDCTGELQYDLVRIVILYRDHRENNASRFLHVELYDVLYRLDIGSRLLFRFGMDEFR